MKDNHPLIHEAIKYFGNTIPYDVQISFMNDLLKCFDSKSIGFFESPTGTGKSLSILSSSIAYITQTSKKLIVATRAHSQIRELIQEIKKDLFKGKVISCSLASRKHMCVNSDFSKLSISELNEKCDNKCQYFEKEKIKNCVGQVIGRPMDIEDLISFGISHFFCSYFLSRSILKKIKFNFSPISNSISPRNW
jgi:Rad3-related DNA helicase